MGLEYMRITIKAYKNGFKCLENTFWQWALPQKQKIRYFQVSFQDL